MSDVAEAIDAEAVPVTLRTRGEATYDERGNAVLGAQSAQTIMAAIQPATGRALQDLPEGQRADIGFVGWSRSPVAEGNQIIYGEQTLRVVAAWPRPQDGFTKFTLSESAT